MKGNFAGPVMALSIGVGIAIGCGGSSSSDVTGGGTNDGGTTTTPPGTPPGTPPPGTNPPPPGGQDAGNDGGGNVPGTPQPIQYGNCSQFNPCTGNSVVGTWTYASGGCLDTLTVPNCPTATASNVNLTVQGQVTFTGTATAGTVTRLGKESISATVDIPPQCLQVQGQQLSCTTLQVLLTSNFGQQGKAFDTATCSQNANGCKCDVTKTQTDQTSGAYTVNGSVLTTGTGQSQRTFDICINPASTFTYQETTQNTPVKATLVMTK